MQLYNNTNLQKYLKDDWILKMMNEENEMWGGEEEARTNQWMYEMENKRMIYADMYGDIIKGGFRGAVLDVGGGYNTLTKILSSNCQYYLLDYMAHDTIDNFKQLAKKYAINWLNCDWYSIEDDKQWEIVIANDIFPNVDQRLEIFLDKFLPNCKELRILVTFYNTPRFYVTQRVDDSEKLTFLSWDGEITALKLLKYESRFIDTDVNGISNLKAFSESIYRNGRQVAYIRLKGDL